MKRKTTGKLLFTGSLLLALCAGCDNNDKVNSHTTGSEIRTNDNNNGSTGGVDNGSTTGSTDATTDGTTSNIGSNRTNSTGSTGHSMDNHSTGVPDSSKYNGIHGKRSGSTTM